MGSFATGAIQRQVGMSTVTPKAGVNSERWRPRYGPLQGASASFARVKAQLGDATVGAAESPAKFAVDVLHHDHIGVDVGLVVGVEVPGRELVQYGFGLRDDGGRAVLHFDQRHFAEEIAGAE